MHPLRAQACQVAGKHALRDAIVLEPELAHVREVEQADGLADGPMLLADAAVLERHEPAAEVRHLGAEADMFLVQRCPLGGHDQTLRLVVVKVVDVVEELLVVDVTRPTEHLKNDVDASLLPLQELGELGGRCRATQPAGEQPLR